MKDRSQIAMLIGLAVLVIAVLTFAPSFGFGSFFHMGGAMPWIMLALAFWFFYGNGRGSCCGRSKSDEE